LQLPVVQRAIEPARSVTGINAATPVSAR